ncbi:hypothetical protein [Streptomyces sp. NPDC005262]|uniref:hypothetical protein n=1 Tax=Streptomyces sp. NPDC005262 TaxID=3364710 RepID=UPI00367FCC57
MSHLMPGWSQPPPLGFAQLARRLRRSTDWAPDRTVAFASLQDTRLLALAGEGVLDGMRGASADGGMWSVRHGWVTSGRRGRAELPGRQGTQ